MRKNRIMEWIFGFAGLAMLVGAVVWGWRNADLVSRAVEVPGQVIGLSGYKSPAPVFTYEYPPGNARTAKSAMGSKPPAHHIGESVTILVDPQDPARAEIKGFEEQWLGPLLVGIFGVLFGGIGFGMMGWRIRREAWEEMVMRNGEKVVAAVTGVEVNRKIRVNGRYPWRILAQGSIAGEARELKSKNLWQDPTPHLGNGKVDVYYLPTDPKRVHMDVRFLPEWSERGEGGS